MTAPRQYCSTLSAGAGEPLPGTGAHQATNALIHWPKARWRHSLRVADGMPPDLVGAVEATVAAGRRVNLIDRKGEPVDRVRVMLTPEALSFDVAPDDVPRLLDAARTGASLASFAPRPSPARILLCCTHGRHDRCCAKFGFAAYRAVAREAARHPTAFDVWETTHLGGCRLAASILSLPSRRKYGRVAPAQARAFLDAEADDRPHLPSYRGGADLAPPEQAAEVAALTAGHRSVRSVTDRSAADGTTRIYDVATDAGAAHVRVTGRAMATYGACADVDDPEERPSAKTVWTGEVA